MSMQKGLKCIAIIAFLAFPPALVMLGAAMDGPISSWFQHSIGFGAIREVVTSAEQSDVSSMLQEKVEEHGDVSNMLQKKVQVDNQLQPANLTNLWSDSDCNNNINLYTWFCDPGGYRFYCEKACATEAAATTSTTTTTTTSGGPTPAPTQAYFQVLSGRCRLSDNGTCYASTNFPNTYPNNDRCSAQIRHASALATINFATERGYDKLTIGSVQYHGNGRQFVDLHVPAGTGIYWQSDYSVTAQGWKICVNLNPGPSSNTSAATSAPTFDDYTRRLLMV